VVVANLLYNLVVIEKKGIQIIFSSSIKLRVPQTFQFVGARGVESGGITRICM